MSVSRARRFAQVLCSVFAAMCIVDAGSARLMAGEPTDLVVETCDVTGEEIPDMGPDPLLQLKTIPPTGAIRDLNIRLDVAHPWVGDLVVVLTHIDTGTFAILVDQPGAPATPLGCGSDDLHVELDDEGAGGLLEDQCGSGPTEPFPTSPPGFKPVQPLSIFDGEELGGLWLISVLDAQATHSGTLNSWCIRANVGPAGIRAAVSAGVNTGVMTCAPQGGPLVVVPGTIVRVCYAVENIGDLPLDALDLQSSLHGAVLSNSVIELAPDGTYFITRTANITSDTQVTSHWAARRGIAAVSADAEMTILIDSDGDGRADVEDACPGGDDTVDSDGDGTADACDLCPDDDRKIAPGNCGCGVAETDCATGNENTNDNENSNENTNTNGNENANENTNTNENENTNTNENVNGNSNENDNSNSNGTPNGNENGNANENQNTNANSNINANANDNTSNSNGNDNVVNDPIANGNDNSNNNNADDNANDNAPTGGRTPHCLIDCGPDFCGVNGGATAALTMFILYGARRRRSR